MAEVPECCDGPNETLRKILLQFISIGTDVPSSVFPECCDGPLELYRKILLSFSYIRGGTTPVPPFTPIDTLAWYKSDSGITLTLGAVSGWADQSGNGFNLSIVGDHRMAYVANVLNGFAALRGDGTDRSLQYANFPTTGITEWTVIFVANSGAAQQALEIVVGMYDFPTSRWGFGVGNDAASGTGWGGTGANAFAAQALTANTFYTRSYVKTAANWNIYQNGLPIIVNQADVTNPSNPMLFLTVGGESNAIANQSQYNLSGDIVEILIYSSALTGSQRASVEAYLRSRYAHY